MIAALLFGASQAEPMVPGQAGVRMVSVPVSSSVLATIVSTNDDLRLLVLWRGDKRDWYSAGPQRQSDGGRNGVLSAALQYGDVDLDLQFDPAGSEAVVQGTKISMPRGANVLLVDGVDRHPGPRAVSALAVDASGTNWDPRNGIASLAALLERSSEVVGFLRCSAEGERYFTTSPCHHFSKR